MLGGPAMTNAESRIDVRVSNWTLATGSAPGTRHVHAAIEPKSETRLEEGVVAMKRHARTVVVVSNQPYQSSVLESLAQTSDYDTVVVESFATAYSSIRRLMPRMVIVCLTIDDVAAFQVLSMLTNDSTISHVPVVTHIMTGHDGELHEEVMGVDQVMSRMPLALAAMN
jgi:PleD family two-component response regulator